MPAANMMENLQLPALQVPEPQGAPEGSAVWSSSSTPTLRRRRFKMRRMKNVQEQSLEGGLVAPDLPGVLAPGKEFLQLPSIEITPSSDEDTPWSNCSTPSASPRRKRFLLRKWLRVRERKECSESSIRDGGEYLLSGERVKTSLRQVTHAFNSSIQETVTGGSDLEASCVYTLQSAKILKTVSSFCGTGAQTQGCFLLNHQPLCQSTYL
ncbi:uncharacterized protein LOC119809361 [Arvicola amphibius]|uniref:uncharacterized protein LOC119809361 n=1 Tax=Arvicola amphibius TaxID=1047088 RepID=UPI001C087FB9|nr:uncharacterized protein LOC119809361 [Arvicola amphibius]